MRPIPNLILAGLIAAGGAAVLMAVLLSMGCATFTTPLRDCDKLCAGHAISFETTRDGPQCRCGGIQ